MPTLVPSRLVPESLVETDRVLALANSIREAILSIDPADAYMLIRMRSDAMQLAEMSLLAAESVKTLAEHALATGAVE